MKKIYLAMIVFGSVQTSHAVDCAVQCKKDSPASNITIDLNKPILPQDTLDCLQGCSISELSDFLVQLAPSFDHPELWEMIGELDPYSDQYKEAMKEGCNIHVEANTLQIESPEKDKCHATSKLEFYTKTHISDWALSKNSSALKEIIAVAKNLSKDSHNYASTIKGLLQLIKRIIQVRAEDYNEKLSDDLLDLEKNASLSISQ